MRLRALVASGAQASIVSTTSLGIQVFALVLRVGCRGGCLCVGSRRTKDIQINCNRTTLEGRKEKYQQVDDEQSSSYQIIAGAAGRTAHAQGEGEGNHIPFNMSLQIRRVTNASTKKFKIAKDTGLPVRYGEQAGWQHGCQGCTGRRTNGNGFLRSWLSSAKGR